MDGQTVFDFQQARAARDQGMQRATIRADRMDDTFGQRAEAFIYSYARTHEQFISEELTEAAARVGIVSPADPRAWGAPFQRAARSGVIRKDGYGISTKRHLSPTPRWTSLVYGGDVA